MFTWTQIGQIAEANDIVEVISERLELKPMAGRENLLVGLSPFHPEKTPSFCVDRTKQSWFCWATCQGGNVFRFVQLVDELTFPEAARKLAQRAGLHLAEAPG